MIIYICYCIAYNTVTGPSAHNCNIFPVSPINPPRTVTRGILLADGTQNVIVGCNCTSNGLPFGVISWFLPDKTLVSSQSSSDGVPYFSVPNLSGGVSNLNIPTFTRSYIGTYTCGAGSDDVSSSLVNATVGLIIPGNCDHIATYITCVSR